jgi:hypothetical protein
LFRFVFFIKKLALKDSKKEMVVKMNNKKSESEKRVGRREFLKKGIRVGLALPMASGAIATAFLTACPQREPEEPPVPEMVGNEDGPRLVTDFPENQAVLNALNYTHETPIPEQRCDNCLFYTQIEPVHPGLGGCQLIPRGLVRAEGWCSSWQIEEG